MVRVPYRNGVRQKPALIQQSSIHHTFLHKAKYQAPGNASNRGQVVHSRRALCLQKDSIFEIKNKDTWCLSSSQNLQTFFFAAADFRLRHWRLCDTHALSPQSPLFISTAKQGSPYSRNCTPSRHRRGWSFFWYGMEPVRPGPKRQKALKIFQDIRGIWAKCVKSTLVNVIEGRPHAERKRAKAFLVPQRDALRATKCFPYKRAPVFLCRYRRPRTYPAPNAGVRMIPNSLGDETSRHHLTS
ncbi:hypothetical protein B0T20DRAFT_255856 [Sordaria brevicollis]|uniref:Uncharacterized protein n=1 Tax=Sordaria brevicollis TaxID=83679 RepID=A0AAE0UAV3_SORBR|nr:hypothetical protein B0T20DRAFT_255856 [Sordaria brevicollis]